MPIPADLADAVRAWAKGVYPTEAGAELLIRHGRAIYERAPWLTDLGPGDSSRPRMVAIDRDVLAEQIGMWSGGERRLVRIAVSLLGGTPVDLSEDLPGLDRPTLSLVLAAIAHAGGSHEHPALETGPGGIPVPVGGLAGSLYPWPAQPSRLHAV